MNGEVIQIGQGSARKSSRSCISYGRAFNDGGVELSSALRVLQMRIDQSESNENKGKVMQTMRSCSNSAHTNEARKVTSVSNRYYVLGLAALKKTDRRGPLYGKCEHYGNELRGSGSALRDKYSPRLAR